MTELATLSTKLAALVAEDDVFADGGARVISKDGVPAPLHAILQEVDNIVLERTLVFGIDNVALHVVVAGRRFRGIVAVDGDAPAMEAVVGEALSREEPDTLIAIGNLLAELCAAASHVTVRSTPARPIGNSGDAGIAASGLAEIWATPGSAGGADISGTPLGQFLADQADIIDAHILFAGADMVSEAGETAQLQEIWESQVTEFLGRHRKLRGAVDGPMMVGLDHALGADQAIALAVLGDESALIACAPDHLPAIMSAWTKIKG